MLKQPKNIHLLINYYNSDNEERQNELIHCLQTNLNIPRVQVHLLVGEETVVPEWTNEAAIIVRYPSDRLTYQHFFDYANQNLPENSIAAITNADIACDRTIYKLEDYVTEKICVCLGRYDKGPNRAWKLTKKNDTQDLWAFRVPMKDDLVERPDFFLGVPGCDNHIA